LTHALGDKGGCNDLCPCQTLVMQATLCLRTACKASLFASVALIVVLTCGSIQAERKRSASEGSEAAATPSPIAPTRISAKRAQARELTSSDEDKPRPIPPVPPPMPPGGGGGPGPTHTISPHPNGSPPSPAPSRTPSPSPLTKAWAPGKTNIPLGKDPQIAVSRNFIVATTSADIFFFDRKTQAPLRGKPGPSGLGTPLDVSHKVSINAFFEPLWKDYLDGTPNPHNLNRILKWPADLLPAEDSQGHPQCLSEALDGDVLTTGRFCLPNPANPTENRTAIQEFYDTRVLFDRHRNRFWVESAARNHFWTEQFAQTILGGGPKYNNELATRLVVIAVSKTEDPRDGFWEYALENNYADWPRFAVHGPYLVVGHNGDNNIFLFDADALANPAPELTRESLKHDSVLTPVDFAVGESLPGGMFDSPDNILPVVQHDEFEDPANPPLKSVPALPAAVPSVSTPTFLVAYSGNKITVFALDTPGKGTGSQPITVTSPTITSASITLDHPIPWSQTNAIYRNSKIFLAGEEAVASAGDRWIWGVRAICIPVFRNPLPGLGSGIVLSKSSESGFWNITYNFFKAGHVAFSYEIPAIEVTRKDDAVIASCRGGLLPGPTSFPAACHDIVFHHKAAEGVVDTIVQAGDFMPTEIAKSHHLIALDLAGVAIDPRDDNTVFMLHAFADKATSKSTKGDTNFLGVIARVTP
jgi:hypothetical protein